MLTDVQAQQLSDLQAHGEELCERMEMLLQAPDAEQLPNLKRLARTLDERRQGLEQLARAQLTAGRLAAAGNPERAALGGLMDWARVHFGAGGVPPALVRAERLWRRHLRDLADQEWPTEVGAALLALATNASDCAAALGVDTA